MRTLIGQALDWLVPHLHRTSEPEEVGWARATFLFGAIWGAGMCWVVYLGVTLL